MRTWKKILKWLALVLLILTVFAGAVLLYWTLRPNRAQVDPSLEIEVWTAVRSGMHDSNTDLMRWQGQLYLVHARSAHHLGTANARLVLWRSPDARRWSRIAEIAVPGVDLRDPKLAVIDDRLHLYVLENRDLEPAPYRTVLSTSEDGIAWTPLQPLEPEGWLFWRPKTLDGETWYVTAYWHEHGASILLRSRDGVHWERVSTIHEGDRNDETALEFLSDGRMLVTARLEGDRAWHQGAKDAATLLAVAAPPYRTWSKTRSMTTRLDGPALFRHGDRVYAVGRFDPEGYDKWYGQSSLFGRKRTSIFEVRPDALIRLTDLPSAGDTGYPGVVIDDGHLYISYYTSDIERDYPWLLGLIAETNILMARVQLSRLETLNQALAGPVQHTSAQDGP